MVPAQQAADIEKCREPDKAGASLHHSFVFLADPPTRDRLSSQHARVVGSASISTPPRALSRDSGHPIAVSLGQ